MSNFNIRINGAANLSQVRTEFDKLRAEVNALNAAMERSVAIPGAVNAQGYSRMAQAVKVNSSVTRNAALSTGMFEVQQLRLNSATEKYTELIQKQKLTFRDMWRERRKGMEGLSKAAYKEQMALRQMVVQQMPGTVGGKKVLDVYIPNEVTKQFDTLGNRIGWIREELKAASTQMVNWGKNTQWAGRQLMVGFTMPVAAFGAATGVLAYQIDKELTRIQKVYDTTAQVVAGNNNSMIAVEQELSRVRVASLNTARIAAQQYGQSATDTLKVQADLAATGLKGTGLQSSTLETMRISTLGELDMETATNMTVALQSAFRDTIKDADDLTEAFNYMNAVENATSLSINDIAEAIPRAGSAMSALGVNVKEMTVLMTAMRESGVQAEQGANALKSATASIIKPSPAALEYIDKLTSSRVDIEAISKNSGGNLLEFMKELGSQFEGIGLGAYEVQQALLAMMGKYQFDRATALYKNLTVAFTEGGNQTAKAYDLMGESATNLADLAETETKRIQESLSGRFKSALETVKVELAEMGMPFLEIGTQILGVIGKLVSAFNSMPEGMKKAFAVSAIGAAVLGPLVMLAGLTANFGGNLIKMAASALRVATNFGLLTKESQAATLAAKLADNGFMSQAESLQRLTAEMRAMTQAAREGALAQKQFMLGQNSAKLFVGGMSTGQNVPITPDRLTNSMTHGLGLTSLPDNHVRVPAMDPEKQKRLPPPRVVGSATGAMPMPMVHPEDPKNAKETSRWMQAGAVSAGVASASMAAMMVSSNKTVDNIAQWAMVASMTAPLFSGMATALSGVKWAGMANAFGNSLTVGVQAMTALKGEAVLAASGLGRGAGFLSKMKGEAVLTASGMGRLGEMARAAGTSLKSGLGSILGMVSPIGWVGIGLAAAAASAYLIYKNNQKAREEVEAMYSDAKGLGKILGYAPSEMQASLNEAGESVVTMSSKVQEFRKEYSSVASAISNTNDVQEKFNYAMAQGIKVIQTGGTAAQAEEAVEIALRAGAKHADEAEAIMLKFKAQMDFSDVDNYVDQLISQVEQKTEDSDYKDQTGWKSLLGEPKVYFDWMQGAMDKVSLNPATDELQRVVATMKEAGSSAANAYQTAFDNNLSTEPVQKAIQATLDELDKGVKDADSVWDKRVASDKREAFITSLVKDRADGWEDYAENLEVGADAAEIMGYAMMFVSEGTDDAAGGADDLASGYDGAAGAADKVTNAQRRLNREMKYAKTINWADEYKSVMQDTQNDIADIASDNFTNNMNSSMDAFRANQESNMDALQASQERASNAQEARHDREQDAFENRWERRKNAVEHAFDARINKVEKAIEAEQKAEEIRQRIFDAEIQRMQRMAEMANTNIDFNVAINSGDLDEAAKIRNDMQAKETEWALGDSGDKSSRASERRQKRLEGRQDHLEKLKDKRLEAISAAEEAEKEALERRQEREKAFLQKQQEMNSKALQKEIDANVGAQQEIWDNRKENLDRAIELFKAYVPKNEKDLREHVARIKSKYKEFNVDTKGLFSKTAVNVGDMLAENVALASRRIKDEVRWATIGDAIAKDMIHGAFGMTPAQFQSWLKTGIWPNGADITAPDYGYAPNRDRNTDGEYRYHTGGIAGIDRGGSAGIRRGHPDEVKATLLKGEGVLNRKAMSKIGPTGFRSLNNGASPYGADYGTGGAGSLSGLGMAGIMGAMMYRALATAIPQAITSGGKAREAKNIKSASKGQGASASGVNYGPLVQGSGGRHRPVPSGYGLTQGIHGAETGFPALDFGVPVGTPVFAAADGKVTKSYDIPGYEPRNGTQNGYRSYGKVIEINHGPFSTLYAHLANRGAGVGQSVKGGTTIGHSGNTGNSSGPHLHFGARGISPSSFVSLSKGAQNIKWDNTVANLHKGEAVLTEDINNQFREGVRRFAEGPNAQYNLHMTVNGAEMDANELVDKTMTALRRMELRKPQSRSGK